MEQVHFSRYQLRTRDMDGARAFYDELFGASTWGAELAAVPLPERAAALGAPPHWLGLLGVRDVDATVRQALALGAAPLGPVTRTTAGETTAVLRDPCGAVFAVSQEAQRSSPSAVAWQLLHTPDRDRSAAFYAALCGRAPGTMADITPGGAVHPHWLFYFGVANLDDAVTVVRARAGKVLETITLPTGERIVACDDPQGAAFGLWQAPASG